MKMRRPFFTLVVTVAAIVGWQPTMAGAETIPPDPPIPASDAGWLTVLNAYRALGGLAPVVEDPALSDADRQHSRYIVESDHFAHDQAVPHPSATDAGARAAAASNLWCTSGAPSHQREPIDGWADSLGHGLWMLRPTLRTVGYGLHVTPPDGSYCSAAAALDVISASEADHPTAPMPLPRDGTVVSPRFMPSATEGALAHCSHLPHGSPMLYVFFPYSPDAPDVTLAVDGRAVPTCAFSGANYSGSSTLRSILEGTRAVAIVVGEPLRAGASYDAHVVAGAQQTRWQFTAAREAGYRMVTSSGEVFAFGGAEDAGDAPVATSAVDIESASSGGYWVLERYGFVHARGGATFHGDVAGLGGRNAAVSMSSTPTGNGYWVFTASGVVLPFGDAPFLGDAGSLALQAPIVDSVATPSGRGYYLVGSDGGVFTFGDAAFAGSTGAMRLNAPVRSLVPDPDGRGYWLVASDGGVFAFDAPFRGSMGGRRLNAPIVGMVSYGDGYVMVGADGGAFVFSSEPFAGSLGGAPPTAPVVALATSEG